MGRNNKRGGRRGGKKRDDTFRSEPIVNKEDMTNDRFVAYYKAQNIISEGEEWEEFMDKLRTPLPTTFRVAGSRLTAQSLNASIRDLHVPNLKNVVFEDQAVSPPVQIPWYPDGLAWQFNVPKKVLRKSPEFKGFHSFLVFETEVGNVSRQEAVSMLPPLFLDVEPHHKVIDMCAAPGSKVKLVLSSPAMAKTSRQTAQLLEALHSQDTLTSTSIPSGMLIANDNDHKRTHLLIHQSARLPSPALMVTNLDASIYPHMKVPSRRHPNKLEPLLFDRILCDVPCSGDGTLRKNVGIWKTWQPMDGNGLHSLQIRILQRAMKMLAPEGRIVYSTCSLNPVENEAVIVAALQSNPEFHLVDVSARFPDLKRSPGVTSWRTTDKSLNIYETHEKFLELTQETHAFKAKLTRSHFPPDDVEQYNLPRCLRIYPHLQDTGGFFVAILERKQVATAPSEKKREAPDEVAESPENKKPRLDEAIKEEPMDDFAVGTATEENSIKTEELVDDIKIEEDVKKEANLAETKVVMEKSKKQGDAGSFKENPYTFLKPGDPTVATCLERLCINSDFPSSNILVRNPEGEAARALYIANDLVKSVVTNNDYVRIRLTFAGTKIFVKQEAGRGLEAQFRVLGEAVPLVLPYVDRAGIIDGDFDVLRALVAGHYPLCETFHEPFKSASIAARSGGHIVRFPQGNGEDATLSHDLYLPIWKSNASLTLMIDKKAKSALSMRVFNKDITTPAKQTLAKDAVVVQAETVEQEEEEDDIVDADMVDA
ncbi:tRNA (Cytosine-5-)-methyltransferase [Mycena indigotica]|uniref:tRNA (Cytosine-5-)-methyltransferase n=1 Tax=Mycena indigotica TaxID=2126181 RepID=A0A8H6VXL9_9AGAR|nr:tRNA (Cytosine-5-)-methyltransferase [Mycena indigotica]KAF7291909.1 tRNA (Cytosine-5-)-methyltransferase [Mycena indigotica]